MNEYNLKVVIEAVADKFDGTIDKVKDSLSGVENLCGGVSSKIDKVGSSVESVGKKMQTTGKYVTAFGAGAVVAGKKFVSAAMEAEQSQTKLTEVMKSMMNATEDDVKAVNALIDAEAKSGVVGKTVQRNGTQQLATYLHNKEALEKLVPAMNDLVVQQKGVNATSGDSINIANMMGKVFSGQVGALRRAGISFNEYQEEVLKTGTEMEKAAMLAEVINQNVGDMNQAMAETDSGKIAKAKQDLAAVGTTIGAALLPAVADLANYVSQNFLPKLQSMADWFKANPIAGKIAVGLGMISAVGGPALIMIGKIVEKTGTLIKTFSKLGQGSGILSKVFAMPPQMLLIIAAIALITAGIVHLYKTNEEFRQKMQETWAQVKEAMGPAIESLKESFEKIKPAIDTIIQSIGEILAVVAPVIAQIISLVVQVAAKVLPVIASILAVVARVVAVIIELVAKLMDFIVDRTEKKIEAVKAIIEGLKMAWSAFKDFMGGIWDSITDHASKKWDSIKEKVSLVIAVMKLIIQALSNPVKTVFDGIASHIKGTFEKVQNAWKKLKEFSSGIASGIGTAFSNMVSKVKGIINKFIRAANVGISVVNTLPGVSISKIPQLAHGTKNWAGGFAYMNEGGRGELTYLPNGAQVIPHDISVQYAKEAARSNSADDSRFYNAMNGMTNAIITGMRMNGNQGGGEYHFTIELGGARVAEQVYKLNKEGTMIMQGV